MHNPPWWSQINANVNAPYTLRSATQAHPLPEIVKLLIRMGNQKLWYINPPFN